MYSAGELLPQPAGDPGADAQEEEARAHGRVHHRPGHHRHHVLPLHPPHAHSHQLRGKLLHNLHNHRSATFNRHRGFHVILFTVRLCQINLNSSHFKPFYLKFI